MIKNFIPTIGVEVHCVLNTKSKMFSPSKNNHYDPSNTNVHPLDLGMPGVLPSVNRAAVKKAIILAKTLDMKIEKNLNFDRKNYFYQDLPKGYQLTQQFMPIGTNGKIILDNGKIINIERIHLEEDTAKETITNGQVFLDFNRCGCPLIEIVSKPDIHSVDEVLAYLNKLKRILIFMNISDGKMEDGSLRADINISIAPCGSKKLGTRIELKNINSFASIQKAINYEINRQSQMILNNESWEQATFRWDELANKTIFMRSKESVVDYHYFAEPNIITLRLPDEFVQDVLNNMNENVDVIEEKLKSLKINEKIIEQLLNDYHLYRVFSSVYTQTKEVEATLTWVVVELPNYLKKVNRSIESVTDHEIKLITSLIELLKSGELNGKHAKTLFPLMLDKQHWPSKIMDELHLVQIKDPYVLKPIISRIVEANLPMLDQYDNRKERVIKMFVGLIMKETSGQANPAVANKILIEIVNEKLNK